jgi:hypothetical protein
MFVFCLVDGKAACLYNMSREPGAGSREPGAGSREPGAGSREPGAGQFRFADLLGVYFVKLHDGDDRFYGCRGQKHGNSIALFEIVRKPFLIHVKKIST